MKAAAVAQNHKWQEKRELKNSNEKKLNSNTSDVTSALEKLGSLTYCNNTLKTHLQGKQIREKNIKIIQIKSQWYIAKLR